MDEVETGSVWQAAPFPKGGAGHRSVGPCVDRPRTVPRGGRPGSNGDLRTGHGSVPAAGDVVAPFPHRLVDSGPVVATPLSSSETVRLVECAKHGDLAARDEVFARYYDRALQMVRRRVGRRLRRDVDSSDILHDGLAVAARKLGDFDMRDRGSLFRWLRAILENQIRDRIEWQNAGCRDHGREVAIDDSKVPLGADLPADLSAPPEILERRERRNDLARHLDELDPRYRALIRARDWEGLDWHEIAERTGRPSADAARMMYHKALIELGLVLRRERARSGFR